jgi:hypothetical protein
MRRLKRAEIGTAKAGGDPALLLPNNDRTLAEMLRATRVPPGRMSLRLRTLLGALADAVARPSETSRINSELAPYHATSPVSRSPDAQLPAQ